MNSILPFLTRYWTVAGWTMLHFLWVGSFAWLITLALRRAVERSSPASRYAVSLASLACLAAIAAGLFVRIATHGGLVEASLLLSPAALPPPVAAPGAHPTLSVGRELTPPALDGPGPLSATGPQGAWLQVVGPAVERAAALLPWAWCLGTPLVALMFAIGVAGTFRLQLRSRPVVDCAVLDVLARLQSVLQVGQRVLLAVTEQVTSPLVVGIVRPMILLPPSLLGGLSPDQLEMILLHELAHVRRWDNLVNLLQRVIEALLFYHPAVWWTSRCVRLEREHCCDALVLAHGRDPQAYAETLASLALPELAPRYAAAAMANHQLVSRIRHILNAEKQAMGLSFKTLVWSAVVLAMLGISCAIGLDLGHGRPVMAQEPEQTGAGPEAIVSQADATSGFTKARLAQGVSFTDFDRDGLLDFYVAMSTDDSQPRPWSPEQATGAPNVTEAGDNGNAWASLTEDGQEERLLLTFDKPVHAAAVLVYESFNPGAIQKLGAYDESGHETIVWEGTDPVRPIDGKGVSVIPVNVTWKTGNVRLYLNSPAVPGFNEVDAVGLLDLATGEVHWAKSAQASSTYADRLSDRDTNGGTHWTAKQCATCHVDAHRESTEQILRGWKHGRTPVCPECFRSRYDMLLPRSHSSATGGVPGGNSLDDRRMRADQLRLELQALEADIARQEGEAARQADAAKRNAREAAYANDVFNYYSELNQQRQTPAAETRDAEAALQELAEMLKRQQAAIDKLTQALEALQSKFGDSSPGSSEGGKEPVTDRDPADPNGAAAMNPVDEHIKLSVSDLLLSTAQTDVDDATFHRRLMLDLTGTLPTPEQVREFVNSTAPEKRRQLVDQLLERASHGGTEDYDATRDPAAAP
jgi:beta-lactamase regulating signal transducer with metallopeptidase domain/uncharacterized coiled-coil protein SlyX